MDFYVVADADTVQGFRYAGISGTIVDDAQAAAAELERLASEGAELIIIITEQIAETVRDTVDAIRLGEELPLIVDLPGPEGRGEGTPSLVDMIRKAVGIQL